MTRREWIVDAVAYMLDIGLFTPEENSLNQCHELAETLYESYVVEQGEEDDPCKPSDAVDEDLTYW